MITIALIYDPRRRSEKEACRHAVRRGIGTVKEGIPPWLEHTGQIPPSCLGGDGYCVYVECDKHAYEILTVIPHGDVRAKDLRETVVCNEPVAAPELTDVDVSRLPLPFREALRDLVKTWEEATQGGKLLPAAGALLKFR